MTHCCLATIFFVLFQDFILEHYSEDGDRYEEAIAELMETRQVIIIIKKNSSITI